MATTRATPAAKKPKASFSIAAAEKEWSETGRPDPFTVELKSGEVITLIDPETLGWQRVAGLTEQQPWLFLEAVVADEDKDQFYDSEFSIGIMRMLMNAYLEHFGVVRSGE